MTSAEQEARRLLALVYNDEGIEVWLHGRKRSLGGACPLDLIACGHGDEVLQRIAQLVDGAFA